MSSRDAAFGCPCPGHAIRALSVAMDEKRDAKAAVEAPKRCGQKGEVFEVTPAANDDLHFLPPCSTTTSALCFSIFVANDGRIP